jgi:DNA-binding PadR family transcriptional regulator
MAAELAEHGYAISPGTLYPTLHRMEADGLLRSVRHVVDGHTRRVYTITPAGRRALNNAIKVLARLAGELLDNRVTVNTNGERDG